MYDYFVLAALAVIAIFSKPSEMRAFVVFSGMCTLMLMVGAAVVSSGNEEYYYRHFFLCGVLHLIILIILSKENKMSDIIFRIYIINIAFIYLNLFGLLIEFVYYMTWIGDQIRTSLIISYNIGCEVLYSLALVAVFYKWYCDGLWTTGIHRIISFFCGNMRSSLPQLCLSEGEKRT